MNKTTTQIVILFFLSFLFFTGCKKEECGDGCYTWGGGYINIMQP